MDLFEAISKRHSYRGEFRDQPVPHEDLRRIVQAGLDAPSGRNLQTTRFVIADDLALVAQISRIPGANTAVQQAKAFVACIIDEHPETAYQGLVFEIEDCAAAVQNMLLSITALGYATVWIDGWLRSADRAQTIGCILGVPQDKIVRVLLPIGVPQDKGPRPDKKPFEQRAWFNRYGHPATQGSNLKF